MTLTYRRDVLHAARCSRQVWAWRLRARLWPLFHPSKHNPAPIAIPAIELVMDAIAGHTPGAAIPIPAIDLVMGTAVEAGRIPGAPIAIPAIELVMDATVCHTAGAAIAIPTIGLVMDVAVGSDLRLIRLAQNTGPGLLRGPRLFRFMAQGRCLPRLGDEAPPQTDELSRASGAGVGLREALLPTPDPTNEM